MKYVPTCRPDPNLADCQPDFGSFANLESEEFRNDLWETLTSVEAVNRIIGSVSAAPSRPPVAAVELLLQDRMGKQVFQDEAKKLTGRLVRQVVEHLGGNFVRRGVPITVSSAYTKGAIYRF